MKPKISVIILTYNSSSTIEKCLKSLKNQTNKNFEVLIVDDDSTDNTLELIKKNLKNYSFKIRFFRNGAHNISRGRNIGIKNANANIIYVLDSDAYADKDLVKNILLSFKDGKTKVVSGDTIPLYTSNLSYANAIVYETIRDLTRKGVWKMEGGNSAFDKDKLKDHYFNEKFKHCEDIDFFTRIDKSRFKYNPKIKIEHEGKDTIKRYFKQQYDYGKWETLFSLVTKRDFRTLSFIPSILIIFSFILIFLTPYSLLLVPFVSLLESLFVFLYKKPKIKFFPYLFMSFFIKIIGWGIGVISGILVYLFNPKFIKYLRKK